MAQPWQARQAWHLVLGLGQERLCRAASARHTTLARPGQLAPPPPAPGTARRLTEGRIPIIGCGGVSTGEQAYKKIRAGGGPSRARPAGPAGVLRGWAARLRLRAPGPSPHPSPCCWRRCAGASLVEVYTAFAYEGPALVPRIKRELAECLQRDGFSSVQQAVGGARPGCSPGCAPGLRAGSRACPARAHTRPWYHAVRWLG
jgi:hypothetical protein